MGLKAKAKFWIRQFPFIYPGKIIASCEDWIKKQQQYKGAYLGQRSSWYKPIFPESFIHNTEPKTLGLRNESAFYNNKSYTTGKAALFYLQNCYLLGQKGMILTANHQVFQEFSHHFGISSLKKFFRSNPFYTTSKNVTKVSGIGAVLISPESQNYYHWLNDVIPRIKLYESVLDQIDHFCISSSVPAKFLDLLPVFGIPAEKILLVAEKQKLHFDYLYVSSLPGSEGRSPQWAVDYIREKLVKQERGQVAKKIYFKRGLNVQRKVLNENEIIARLQSLGFEIIDPDALNVFEQINLMDQVKIVVSAHGAALSNLLFSRDRTAVIELFSPDYFRTDCFYTLSSIRKLNYWYLAGDKPTGAEWGDITVSEEILVKTVQKLDD